MHEYQNSLIHLEAATYQVVQNANYCMDVEWEDWTHIDQWVECPHHYAFQGLHRVGPFMGGELKHINKGKYQ